MMGSVSEFITVDGGVLCTRLNVLGLYLRDEINRFGNIEL